MMIPRIIYKAALTVSATTLSIFALNTAMAKAMTGNASVTILETLTFTENQTLSFGSIASTDGICSMNATGILSGTCLGQPSGSPGQFTVKGSIGQTVSVSVDGGSSIDGVSLTPILNSSARTTLDGQGQAVVRVSGDLSLANAIGGNKALTYVLTVSYN